MQNHNEPYAALAVERAVQQLNPSVVALEVRAYRGSGGCEDLSAARRNSGAQWLRGVDDRQNKKSG